MRRTGVTWVLAAALAGSGAVTARLQDEPEACDLAKIEALDFCAECQILVEKDTLNDKGEHVDCEKKPGKADFCIKLFYLCESCGTQADQAGKCANCQADLKEQDSKSRILFHCPKCEATSEEPKTCDAEDCAGKGQAYTKTCSDSGIPPHIRKK